MVNYFTNINKINNHLSPQLIEHTNRRPRHMMLNTQKRRPRHMMLKIRLYVLVCPILLNVVNQAFMCQTMSSISFNKNMKTLNTNEPYLQKLKHA